MLTLWISDFITFMALKYWFKFFFSISVFFFLLEAQLSIKKMYAFTLSRTNLRFQRTRGREPLTLVQTESSNQMIDCVNYCDCMGAAWPGGCEYTGVRDLNASLPCGGGADVASLYHQQSE